MNCSPSSRQLKKYKISLPVDYLLAVFMQLASIVHVSPLELELQDFFASVYCNSNLYNLQSFLQVFLYQKTFTIISFSFENAPKPFHRTVINAFYLHETYFVSYLLFLAYYEIISLYIGILCHYDKVDAHLDFLQWLYQKYQKSMHCCLNYE